LQERKIQPTPTSLTPPPSGENPIDPTPPPTGILPSDIKIFFSNNVQTMPKFGFDGLVYCPGEENTIRIINFNKAKAVTDIRNSFCVVSSR